MTIAEFEHQNDRQDWMTTVEFESSWEQTTTTESESYYDQMTAIEFEPRNDRLDQMTTVEFEP